MLLQTLTLLALFAATPLLAQQRPQPGAQRQVTQPWQWEGRDHLTHVVVLIFEASTGRLRQASVVYGGSAPCGSAAGPGDSSLVEQAIHFLRGVGWTYIHPGQYRAARLATEFVRVSFDAGDPTAFVVFHRQGGLIYAGSSMWMGHGDRYYPPNALDPWNVFPMGQLAPSPDSSWMARGFPDSLLTTARRLNVVQALAGRPYYATAFLHNKEGQPFLSDADWVLLLTRRGRCS